MDKLERLLEEEKARNFFADYPWECLEWRLAFSDNLKRADQVTVCLSQSTDVRDHRLAALSLGQHCMRQPFFDDQPESEPGVQSVPKDPQQ